jgi:hypothetical protein
MKKKILAIVIVLICAVSAIYYNISHKDKSSDTVNTTKPATEFKVKSAFADIDRDMIIQDKDPKDDDTSGDYIFIKFTNEVTDNKKNDDSNPVSLKSYSFDNISLPAGTKIYVENRNQITIKLKDGYLKGVNSPHSLVISKNLVDKHETQIKGNLNLNLPYSNSVSDSSNSSSANKNGNANNASNNSSNSNTNKNSSASNNTSSSGTLSTGDSSLPKYKAELGKGLPYTTIVLIRLDTPNPENYKVSIEGTQLDLKTDSSGKKAFVKAIKKVYELDQIQKLIKIEKVK